MSWSWVSENALASMLPKDQDPVTTQIFSGGGKAISEVVCVIDIPAEESILGRSLQQRDLKPLIVGHGPEQELDLPARLALVVENLRDRLNSGLARFQREGRADGPNGRDYSGST